MKITKVERASSAVFYHYITTEDGTEYRRNSATDWEEQIGGTWEGGIGLEEELEPFFQAYIKAHPEAK